MAVNVGKAGILNWQCEFRDAELEALFKRAIMPHHAHQLRLALCSIAGLFLAFALADYRLLGAGEAFGILLGIRLVTIAVCLTVALVVWQRPDVVHHPFPVNLVCVLGVTVLLLTILMRPIHEGIHVASLAVASMAIYLFLPNRLIWILFGNAYLAVGFVTVTLAGASLPPILVMTSLLLLLFVNLLGWMTINLLKRLKREQFALLLEERRTNQRLKTEITERKELEARLRHMACTDDLTGIANRRHFFDLAGQELRRARRDGTPLAICMVDVDHFKQLNDRFGHAVGDRVLATIAGCCQGVLRESDILGRYGGEEFVIALPLADLSTAEAIGERLRQKVSALDLPILGNDFPLTVTVGISRLEAEETRLEPTLLRADRALYEGKARGRNCVVVAARPLPCEQPRVETVFCPAGSADSPPSYATPLSLAPLPAAEPPPATP